ncbi:ATP-binding protein [Roseateles oligotrophus]|uniref:histidine kinase n=1 Tax=Roseateles oligotrophus TaxID=1769250 RepID=A0ABT2YCR1_9BURK|nr:ATP-binding protein [Roseateles oligotrophus]MCV2367810.1 sensor histidine kinase N-terminal domain-containing protein [Roseateles oligotrophus]
MSTNDKKPVGTRINLRLRLLLQIGLALSLLWGAVALWMQRELESTLRGTLDQRLVMAAQMVADLAAQNPAIWTGPAAERPALPLIPAADDSSLVCQISDLRGEVYAHSAGNSRPAEGSIRADKPGFAERLDHELLWRTYTLKQGDLLVTTADRIDKRSALLQQLMLAATLPFVVALLGGLAVLWWGVGVGLRPLERLRQTLALRNSRDLTPVVLSDLPADLAPLVGSLNDMLERIDLSLARERRFTADAAHELRTPLTAIKLHLQVLGLSQGQAAEVALEHANEGVARLQQVLAQLLTLAELDVDEGAAQVEGQPAGADVEEVIRLALRDCPALPPARLRLHKAPGPALLLALPLALAVTALRNLFDNAARHSPADEVIDLSVSTEADRLILVLSDRGPGMSDEDMARATERFWRRAQGPGSGLGLAIVLAIVKRYGGAFSLARRAAGGLELTLNLPRASAAN